MQGTLKQIRDIITHKSAIQYAEEMLLEEKNNCVVATFNANTRSVTEEQVPYLEYMLTQWGKPGDLLTACIERSRISKLERYAEYVRLYSGFYKNGGLFVLNKKEKFVSFLYETKEKHHSFSAYNEPCKTFEMLRLHIHYNPLNVDCIDETIKKDLLDRTDQYGYSSDEEDIIRECDYLIRQDRKE